METQLITANKLVEYVMSLSTPITQDQLNFKLSSNSNEHKRRFLNYNFLLFFSICKLDFNYILNQPWLRCVIFVNSYSISVFVLGICQNLGI